MGKKVAVFDSDCILIENNWKYPSIPVKLKQFNNDNYTIIIINFKKNKQSIIESLNIPVIIVEVVDGTYITDATKFKSIVIDRNLSFYVGDIIFAEKLEIKHIEHTLIFNIEVKINIPVINKKEIVIMVGYPGSGKSTVAKFLNAIHLEEESYKAPNKMIEKAIEYVPQSIIFDATNGSAKKRAEYIAFAKKHNYSVKCIHISTSLEESYKRNKSRPDDKQISRIVYTTYQKYFDEPNENEGFQLITL